MIFAEPFLNGMFYSLIVGTAFNFLLSTYFFVRTKKRWNSHNWAIFYAPIGLLVLTIIIGIFR